MPNFMRRIMKCCYFPRCWGEFRLGLSTRPGWMVLALRLGGPTDCGLRVCSRATGAYQMICRNFGHEGPEHKVTKLFIFLRSELWSLLLLRGASA